MDGAAIPPGYCLAWGFSVLICLVRFSQNGHLQRNPCWCIFQRALPAMFFPRHMPQSPTVFPGEAPKSTVRSDPGSYGDFALPWDPVHVKVCSHHSRMGSLFPSVLCTSPTVLQCQMLWGLFLPMLDPKACGYDVGLRTLTPIVESLWYSYFSFCAASHPWGMVLLISCNFPSYLLMWPPVCLLE